MSTGRNRTPKKQPKTQMSASTRKLLREARTRLAAQASEQALLRQEAVRQSLRRPSVNNTGADLTKIRRTLGAACAERISFTAAAYGYRANVRVTGVAADQAFSGRTDHETIFVEYSTRQQVVPSPAAPDYEKMLRYAVEGVLGVGYHELAHIRFSPHFLTIWDARPEDWAHSQYVTKEVWNIVEDQRIETLSVQKSPNMARYFTTVNLWLDMIGKDDLSEADYLMLAGRFFLPEEILSKAREAKVEERGEDWVQNWEGALWAFMSAPLSEVFGHLDTLITLLAPSKEENSTDGNNGDAPTSNSGDISGTSSPFNEGSVTAEEYDQQAQSMPTPPQQSSSDGKIDGPSNPDGYSSDGEGSGETHENEPDYGAGADDELVDQILSEINAATNDENSHLIPTYDSEKVMSPELISKANQIAEELVREMQSAVSEKAPHWRERTSSGVLNPFVYKTRRRADLDFYRHLDGSPEMGFDMEVSLLLDHSGSMWEELSELSVAAHAVKKACDDLGVPCTVTLFASESSLLYEPEDEPKGVLIGDGGGTNPRPALMDLNSQRKDSARPHLVIVMTDGAFNEDVELIGAGENRHFIGLAKGRSASEAQLRMNGMTDVFHIDSSLEMPKVIGDYLVDMALS